MRVFSVLLLSVAVVAAGAGIGAPAASAASCQVTWGSLPKASSELPGVSPVMYVRAGRHDCYDRLVVDMNGGSVYDVRYVQVVRDAAGAVVPLRGGARLQLTMEAPTRALPMAEAVPVTGYRTFRQVALVIGGPDGTTFGLGVRARLPFRVFWVGTPSNNLRLVVDVAHQW
jgi:hypothetical protein